MNLINNKVLKKTFSKTKKYKKILIIFCLFMEIMFSINLYIKYYDRDIVKKDINNRLLTIKSGDDISEITSNLTNIKGIESIYPKWDYYVVKAKEETYIMNYIYTNGLKVVKGKSLDNLETNEVLVSSDSSLKLNDKIEFEHDNKVASLTIAGIYDAKIGLDIILANPKTMKIYSKMLENEYEIIVRDYSDVSNVVNKVSKFYDVKIDNTKGMEILQKNEKVISILNITILFLSIITLVLIVIITDDIINENQKNIAILKSVGYKNSTIKNLVSYNLFNLLSSAFVKSSIILLIICLIIHKFLVLDNWIFILLESCIFTLLVLFITFMICMLLQNKVKKTYPIILYKEQI